MTTNDTISLLKYIEEINLNKINNEKNCSFFSKISWLFYIFPFLIAFKYFPMFMEFSFSFKSSFINFIVIAILLYLTHTYRKSILPPKKQRKNQKNFLNITKLIEEKGFEKAAKEINDILYLAPIIYKSNKEFIYIVDEALSIYLNILLKISNITNNKSSFKKIKFKKYNINKILKIDLSSKQKYINILCFIEIIESKNFSGIILRNIVKFGNGKHFEGIEILNGLILIGKNEYFDGIIVGSFRFGKELSNIKSEEKNSIKNNALLNDHIQIENDNLHSFETNNLLKNNLELKKAAIQACSEISLIRSHCTEFLANDIKTDLQNTSSNLKEKMEREKRIHQELKEYC